MTVEEEARDARDKLFLYSARVCITNNGNNFPPGPAVSTPTSGSNSASAAPGDTEFL